MEKPIIKRVLRTMSKTTSDSEASETIAKPTTKNKNILLSDECLNHLNYRVQQEEYSGRIYLSMSLWLDNNGYVNGGKLWRKYSDEEMKHADLAREYLLAMGVQPGLEYLKEQVEEHAKMQNWMDQLLAFGEDKIAMRLLDHEMKDYL